MRKELLFYLKLILLFSYLFVFMSFEIQDLEAKHFSNMKRLFVL